MIQYSWVEFGQISKEDSFLTISMLIPTTSNSVLINQSIGLKCMLDLKQFFAQEDWEETLIDSRKPYNWDIFQFTFMMTSCGFHIIILFIGKKLDL